MMGEPKIFFAGAKKEFLPKYTDNVLTNVLDNCSSQREIIYTLEMVKLCHAKNTILDSSGFQVLMCDEAGKKVTFDPNRPLKLKSDSLNISPVHVAKSAAILKPTIMMVLDYPVKQTDDPLKQYTDFRKKLGYNITWAWESAEAREKYCPKAQLYLPVQSYNIEQVDLFWKCIDGVNFDGISIPIRNMSIEKLSVFFMYFYQRGVKNIHILGTTTPLIIAFAAFIAKHLFESVSLDSSTWQKAARTASYINHRDLSSEYLGNVVFKDHFENDCPCPFCRDKSFSDIYNLKSTAMTYFLGRHNIWVTEYFSREVYNHCVNVFMLKRFLKKNLKARIYNDIERLCNTLTILNNFKDEDIYDIENKIMMLT